GESSLALPLMIELAAASAQIDTTWTVISTVPVVLVGIPLSLRAGHLPIYPVCVVGIWLIAMLIQVFMRQWTIKAETARLDVEKTAESLAAELEERKRAEAERERLRDQFMHAQR